MDDSSPDTEAASSVMTLSLLALGLIIQELCDSAHGRQDDRASFVLPEPPV